MRGLSKLQKKQQQSYLRQRGAANTKHDKLQHFEVIESNTFGQSIEASLERQNKIRAQSECNSRKRLRMQIGAQLHKREAQRSAILNCLKLKLQLRKLDWSATPDCHMKQNLERNSKNFIEAQLKVNSRLSDKVHLGAQAEHNPQKLY